MRRFYLFMALLLTISLAGTVYGQKLSPELEMTAKKIEGELMAPCCWTQPVSVHSSPIANEMKVNIRKMLAAGKSRQEILDHYVATHDIAILSVPPQTGFNRLSFLMPVFLVLFGLGVVAIAVKMWTDCPVGSQTGLITGPVDEEATNLIERELKDMD